MTGEPKLPETPAELWQSWSEAWQGFNEAASRMWSLTPQGSQESAADPYGLFRSWQQFFDSTTQGGKNFSADPFALFKQWYDATSESWSKTVGEAIATEQFAETIGRFLDSFTSFTIMFRRANEQYFSNLQLPTRSDIARVATLVVNLEEKVDRIEDTLIEAGESPSPPTAEGAISKLEARMNRLERKLDRVLAALEKPEAKERAASGSDQDEQGRNGALQAPGGRAARASGQRTKGG
jgi:polyhydroxyalkanoic acid synthase PhaR subunit